MIHLFAVPAPSRWQRLLLLAFMSVTTLWSLGAILHPIDPPLVMWNDRPVPQRPNTMLLPEAELVELASGERSLRGYYVPSDPGAPIVLHLLGSGLSVFDENWGVKAGVWSVGLASLNSGVRRLAESGLASLAIDYTGVGRSDGLCSTAEFAADMRVMWAEALRRVDGDSSRVVIRGTSLGALGAGLLLAEGARPRALLLHTPVLADTVVDHFAQGLLPAPLPALITPLFSAGLSVDLPAALRESGVPTHLFLERGDELLPEDEARLLNAAASTVPGSSVTYYEASKHWGFGFIDDIDFAHHTVASMLSGAVSDAELQVLRKMGAAPNPSWRTERVLERSTRALREHFRAHAGDTQRAQLEQLCSERLLAHPDLLLAAALAGTDPSVVLSLDDKWPSSLPGFLCGKTPAQQVALLDLSDPSGDLPGELFVQLVDELWGPSQSLNRALTPLDLDDARALWGGLNNRIAGFPGPFVRVVDAAIGRQASGRPRQVLDLLWEHVRDELCRQHADGEPSAPAVLTMTRRAQRVVLKACGLPDRLVEPESELSAVQAFDGGAWRDVHRLEPLGKPGSAADIQRFLLVEEPDTHAELSSPWWIAHRTP